VKRPARQAWRCADLFETARAEVERTGAAGHGQRDFWRWLTLEVLFMRPRLLRFVGRLLHLYQSSGLDRVVRASGLLYLLPGKLRKLEPQTPRIAPGELRCTDRSSRGSALEAVSRGIAHWLRAGPSL